MKKYLLLSLFAVSTLALAQSTPMTREEYHAARARIVAEGEAAEARCAASLRGNAKDVCEEEAEGREKIALAELEQRYLPSPRNARKVAMAKIDAQYEVAKEKCDALTGAAETACEKEAKAQRARAKAQLTAAK
jgi:hypothetical protein